MSIKLPDKCLCGSTLCQPLAQIVSTDRSSYVCCGHNMGYTHDPFTVCWHNDEINERSNWDRRDILDTISVLAQALSVDANISANEEQSDENR